MQVDPNLFRYAVEHTSLQVYWADRQGHFLWANPSACAALGYSLEEMLALTVADVDDLVSKGADWLEFLSHLSVNEKTVIETVHRLKDGSTFVDQVTIALTEADGETVICGLAQDISIRKQLQRDLTRRNDVFRAAVNTTDLGFWIVDMDGRFLDVNESYLSRSGYSRDEMIGMNITDIDALDSHAEMERRIHQVMADGNARFRSQHRRKDGSIWPVEVVTSYSPIEEGRFFVFIQDITEKVATERREMAYQAEHERGPALSLLHKSEPTRPS